MKYDWNIIITSVVTYIFGLIAIIACPCRRSDDVHGIKRFVAGVAIVIVATLLNSLTLGDWSLNLIFDFLLLKKVGLWLFRISVSVGYLLLFWSVSSILTRNTICQLSNNTTANRD